MTSASRRALGRGLRAELRGRIAGARDRLRARAVAASQSGDGANESTWVLPDQRLWELVERYGGSFRLPAISYGTARDFADSRDNLRGLSEATPEIDMKNLQRCWMLKAILGNVQRGGRLIEIGAGEPLVAGALARLGYDVTVVDPYDGSGNGPREYEEFRRGYPDVRFIRDQFPPEGGLDDPVDAVYSISVLEHVAGQVPEIVQAAAEMTASDGCAIHAVDHVVAGWSTEEHKENLARIVTGLNLPIEELERAVDELSKDAEAYFVSVEAHDRWRGALPYDDYPMRRIASIQLFRRY
jgi:uncharacterized UPF0146 family protein